MVEDGKTAATTTLEEKVRSLFSVDDSKVFNGDDAGDDDNDNDEAGHGLLSTTTKSLIRCLDEDTRQYLTDLVLLQLDNTETDGGDTADDQDMLDSDIQNLKHTLTEFLMDPAVNCIDTEENDVGHVNQPEPERLAETTADQIIRYLRKDTIMKRKATDREKIKVANTGGLDAGSSPIHEHDPNPEAVPAVVVDNDDGDDNGSSKIPEATNNDSNNSSINDEENSASSTSSEEENKEKSPSKEKKQIDRQRRRQDKKLIREKKSKKRSKSPKSSPTSPLSTSPLPNETRARQDMDGGDIMSSNALRKKVEKIQDKSSNIIEDMDDYGSAWADAKSNPYKTTSTSGGEVVWGGRGYGGRGVNRGLAVYRGRDAVVQNLTLSYGGGRDLLHETHLALSHGHRYGLMGQNGCGKSTLLRRIASKQIPGWPMHLSVEMVEQEVLASPDSVIDVMMSIQDQCSIEDNGRSSAANNKEQLQSHIDDLESMLEKPEIMSSPDEMESIAEKLSVFYDELDEMEASADGDNDYTEDENEDEGETNKSSSSWSKLDKRSKTILKGLHLPKTLLDTPSEQLSGGWRMRLALARALYLSPDLLLLDEPTNHLDLSAVLFLESYLVDNNMTAVIVSHDGNFLDAVCTDIIKFENCKLKYHVGNYTSFRLMEEQTWSRNCNKADAVARKEKKTMEFIQKQRSMSNSKRRDDNKQRQAAERQKKFGRIGLFSENGQKYKLLAAGNTKRGGANRAGHIYGAYTNAAGFQSAYVSNETHQFQESHQGLNFKFPAAPPLKGGGANLITLEDGIFKYPDSKDWLLDDLNLHISQGSRVALVGGNGCGKSTLLKILDGDLTLCSGEYHRHPNLKIAYITQHHIEQLASYLEKTPVEYFMEQHKAKDEQEARQFLGGFGIVGPLALQMIGTLSGGQKARLAFATVMCDAPHLLILDEPTNHLDSDSLQKLASAVQNFEGAVIIVSHNQEFLSQCVNEMWTISNRHVKVQVMDDERETFDEAFTTYREELRKELRL
mmetsp:Transcript_8446/g.21071  ORF Transcript_8446/g.21071 Transcript_8446/m.21071 type:complete len:1014 (+) Transcript_8446:203-3244(+)